MKYSIVIIAACIFTLSCNISQNEKGVTAKTIVSGKILDFDERTELTIINKNLCIDSKREVISIDSTGHFHYTIEINSARDLRIISNKANFLLLLFPGDSVFVEFKTNTSQFWKSINFKGDRQIENTIIANFQDTFQKSIDYNAIIRHQAILNEGQFIHFMDSILDNSMELVNSYVRKYKPPKEVNGWIKWHASEPYYYHLLWYPRENEIEVSSDYFDFHNRLLPIQLDDLLATYNLDLFISGYFAGLILPRVISDNALIIEKWQKDPDLAKQEERIADSILNLGIIKHSKCSITKELVLTYWYANTIRDGDFGRYEYFKDFLDNEITIDFLRASLSDYYYMRKNEIENPLTTNCISNKIEIISLRNILDSLFNSKEGEILVFNFWATWCSPCIANFPRMNIMIEEFEGQPVNFVFLCLDGTANKSTWERLIERHKVKGIHYGLNEKEARELRNVFGFQGVPHYAIFDNKGKLRLNGHMHLGDNSVITKYLE